MTKRYKFFFKTLLILCCVCIVTFFCVDIFFNTTISNDIFTIKTLSLRNDSFVILSKSYYFGTNEAESLQLLLKNITVSDVLNKAKSYDVEIVDNKRRTQLRIKIIMSDTGYQLSEMYCSFCILTSDFLNHLDLCNLERLSYCGAPLGNTYDFFYECDNLRYLKIDSHESIYDMDLEVLFIQNCSLECFDIILYGESKNESTNYYIQQQYPPNNPVTTKSKKAMLK